MSEGQVGVLLLVIAAAVFAIPLHLRVRGFWDATLVSGLAASLLLQVLDTARRGYPDKFALVGLIFGTIWGALVSAAIGLCVRKLRPPAGTPGQRP